MTVRFSEVQKICQVTGEWDRQLNKPVPSRTDSRFGLFGTDLGSSFEHDGRLWFLFGDTGCPRARVTSLAAIFRNPDHIDLFFLAESGIVNVMPRTGTDPWQNPVPLCGARFAGATRLAAVSRDPRHMEVFVIGEDGIIRGRWFWDGTWHDWYVLGDAQFNQTAGIAAVSRDPQHMEVFVIGKDGIIRGRWFWDNAWHDWYVLGDAQFNQTTGIAAVSRDPRHMEVFAIGEDGIRGRWFWDNKWHDWYVLGDQQFSQTAGIAAASLGPDHMEVFAPGPDGLMRARSFLVDTWHDWYVVGPKQFSQAAGVAAVSFGTGGLDLVAMGNELFPWRASFKNLVWSNWDFIQTLNDSVAWTTAKRPTKNFRLNFLSTTGDCARYQSPMLFDSDGQLVSTGGFSVPFAGFSADGNIFTSLGTPLFAGGFSVPTAGFSANGNMYVFYTEHTVDLAMARTRLAVAINNDPIWLQARYVTSKASMDPAFDGHFINIACKVVQPGHPSLTQRLPFDGPALLLWGSGLYRMSHIYLAAVPLADVERSEAWWFYTGVSPSRWSCQERDARPVVRDGRVGELSVTWIDSLRLWLILFNGNTPILGTVSSAPWGPWSDVQTVYDTDTGLGQFIHKRNSGDKLSDPGTEDQGGAVYGGYLIDRFTQPIDNLSARIYFLMSTWNPYNTVLMSAKVAMVPTLKLPRGQAPQRVRVSSKRSKGRQG
jgi:hypothetical protein